MFETGTQSPKQGKQDKKDLFGKFVGRRTRKPKKIAVVTEACTGCAGSPVCELYCPVQDCMPLLPADDVFPGGRVVVDPLKCVGCEKCIADGPKALFLECCPWDAIVMVRTADWEAEHGTLPY